MLVIQADGEMVKLNIKIEADSQIEYALFLIEQALDVQIGEL